jgi:diadenosine tetraphosphate (Ap4A) HIT family hydrolase
MHPTPIENALSPRRLPEPVLAARLTAKLGGRAERDPATHNLTRDEQPTVTREQASGATAPATNDTIAKFGYPETLLADYDHWVVMLRGQQVTLGAMVLACKSPATSFADIDQAAFTELKRVTNDIETVLSGAFEFDKMNYLMLMMVDPHVHFHVIPRYGAAKTFAGVSFSDPGWPAVPDLGSVNQMDDQTRDALKALLSDRWPTR